MHNDVAVHVQANACGASLYFNVSSTEAESVCMFRMSRLAVCESTRKSCSAFHITGHRKLRCRQRRRTQLWRLMLQLDKRNLSTKKHFLRKLHAEGLARNTMQKHVKVPRNDGHAWINGKGLESDKTWFYSLRVCHGVVDLVLTAS